MNYACLIFGAIVLALIAAIATTVAMLCQSPQCPGCESRDIEEYPAHCICRICGERWEEPKRFGRHGGSDS